VCDWNPWWKKRKISKKVEHNHDHQYFEESKKYQMKRSCFNYIAIKRSIRPSLKLIKGVGNLVKLETTEEDILYFKTFILG